MKHIITKLIPLPLAAAAFLFAHGGFEHVQGTVAKLQDGVLTVKTAKGDVAVKLNAKTEITRDNHAARLEDLTAGVRVVVDIAEGDQSRTAHSVKIGVAAPVKPAPAKKK